MSDIAQQARLLIQDRVNLFSQDLEPHYRHSHEVWQYILTALDERDQYRSQNLWLTREKNGYRQALEEILNSPQALTGKIAREALEHDK